MISQHVAKLGRAVCLCLCVGGNTATAADCGPKVEAEFQKLRPDLARRLRRYAHDFHRPRRGGATGPARVRWSIWTGSTARCWHRAVWRTTRATVFSGAWWPEGLAGERG